MTVTNETQKDFSQKCPKCGFNRFTVLPKGMRCKSCWTVHSKDVIQFVGKK